MHSSRYLRLAQRRRSHLWRSLITLGVLALLASWGSSASSAETPTVTGSNGLTVTDLAGDSYTISGDRAGKLKFSFSSHSFYLTDFNELSWGEGATQNVFGIPSTPTAGYDATINLIPGYGY